MWLLQNKMNDVKAMRYYKQAVCGSDNSGTKVCCTSSGLNIIRTVAPEIDHCGTAEIQQKIIGGEEVQLGKVGARMLE